MSLQPLAGVEDPAGGHRLQSSHQAAADNSMFAQMEQPWANSRAFAVDLLALSVIAGIVGVLSYGYCWIVGELLEKWLSAAGGLEYPEAYLKGGPALGCPFWIPLCWAGGTAVGVLKWAVGLDTFDTFLVEIRAQHCDSLPALKTTVCCMASLLSGAALGPEAGLAAAGGGIGTLLARVVASLGPDYAQEEAADARRRLYVIGGICAAFGTILPAPWVSLLICFECSFLKVDDEGKKLSVFGRRSLFLLGITATVAFMVRYAVKAIPPLPDLAHKAKVAGEVYDNLMPFKGALLGILAACAALVYAIIGALFKAVFGKLGRVLEGCCGTSGRIICLCSLAGLTTGVLGYLVPLSLASGKEGMMPVMVHSGQSPVLGNGELVTTDLLWIAVAKTASYSAAAAGGMVGGPFFPVLFVGVVVGEMCARIPLHWSVYPAVLTVPVAMVAMPSAVFPLPFTLVAMPLSYFHLGPLWCVPILSGIIAAYTLIVGTGLVRKLAGQ